MDRIFNITLICMGLLLTLPFSSAHAQSISKSAKPHAKKVAVSCPGKWTSQKCLSAVSASNLAMAANYGEALKKKGKNNALEHLKNSCAASTAATEGEYPASAMRSAYVECANIIVDIEKATGMKPDPTLYQILYGAVLCLDKNMACFVIEQGLKKHR